MTDTILEHLWLHRLVIGSSLVLQHDRLKHLRLWLLRGGAILRLLLLNLRGSKVRHDPSIGHRVL